MPCLQAAMVSIVLILCLVRRVCGLSIDCSRPARARSAPPCRSQRVHRCPANSRIVVPISWLIGKVRVTWDHPTIEDFRFGQEVTFTNDGRPFLIYTSKSWILDDEGNRFARPPPIKDFRAAARQPT